MQRPLSILLAALIIAMPRSVSGQAGPHVPSPATKWLDVALEVTANDVDRVGAKPTVQSRALGIAVTAMYDAWAAYDARAVGTRLGGEFRRPAAERTPRNREVAISYAIYRVLLDLYPADAAYITQQFTAMGYDPTRTIEDPSRPEGIGNRVARALIEYRHRDGANQLGDEVGSSGTPYSDYTFYRPVNSPDRIIDPDRWHPLPFVSKEKGTFYVDFLTPQWYRVTPFGLKHPAQFRAPPLPVYGSPQLEREVEEVIALNANLTPERKATVEFMRDGPRSTGQAGHWLKFAQMVSARDRHDLERDVKLYFAVGNTAMDAFIASWETKRYYDSSRPWTLVRLYKRGQMIKGWGGPDRGTVEMPADQWHPYSPADFVSPPFPAYVSGHSAVSGACAKMLELFTGSDHFGEVEVRRPGIITETPGDPVSLPLPTFSATAELAGVSRVMGGYHIQADNVEGLKMGRQLATYLWEEVVQRYFDGESR